MSTLTCPLFAPEVLERARTISQHVLERRAGPGNMARKIVNLTLKITHQPDLITLVDRKAAPFARPIKLMRGLDSDGTFYRLHEDGGRYYCIADLLLHEKPQTLVLLGRDCGVPLTLKAIADARLPSPRK